MPLNKVVLGITESPLSKYEYFFLFSIKFESKNEAVCEKTNSK